MAAICLFFERSGSGRVQSSVAGIDRSCNHGVKCTCRMESNAIRRHAIKFTWELAIKCTWVHGAERTRENGA